MFGIFFDSAVRHDSQHFADSRAGKSAGVENFLPDAFCSGGAVGHGQLCNGVFHARDRSRISFAAWIDDFSGVVLVDIGESIFDKTTA